MADLVGGAEAHAPLPPWPYVFDSRAPIGRRQYKRLQRRLRRAPLAPPLLNYGVWRKIPDPDLFNTATTKTVTTTTITTAAGHELRITIRDDSVILQTDWLDNAPIPWSADELRGLATQLFMAAALADQERPK